MSSCLFLAQLRVFDVDTLECLTVIKTPPHRGAVCGLAVGHDGTVYIGGQDTRVQVYLFLLSYQRYCTCSCMTTAGFMQPDVIKHDR